MEGGACSLHPPPVDIGGFPKWTCCQPCPRHHPHTPILFDLAKEQLTEQSLTLPLLSIFQRRYGMKTLPVLGTELQGSQVPHSSPGGSASCWMETARLGSGTTGSRRPSLLRSAPVWTRGRKPYRPRATPGWSGPGAFWLGPHLPAGSAARAGGTRCVGTNNRRCTPAHTAPMTRKQARAFETCCTQGSINQ